MKINLELVDGESTVNYADEKEVFRTVKQIYWHIKQIEKKDYKISSLDFCFLSTISFTFSLFCFFSFLLSSAAFDGRAGDRGGK